MLGVLDEAGFLLGLLLLDGARFLLDVPEEAGFLVGLLFLDGAGFFLGLLLLDGAWFLLGVLVLRLALAWPELLILFLRGLLSVLVSVSDLLETPPPLVNPRNNSSTSFLT